MEIEENQNKPVDENKDDLNEEEIEEESEDE
jgi:hypothetical protein